ncbi:GerAB/ArcD/ProY family transporter [Caldibacillus debilis]|jgi:spore germination protein KB|uniref:Spore germination protein (Amino acid permease) n=1 Tax=Caldibacillus debilis GB1 TaxID=1339248 RepID=A0A420VFN8_9BACI|nr:GerAB/ArcD/ProY family transporter [Caldibacillus debilis]RKO62431.1 spore germination protein (amino acid permease) [Caldibacillus debilis GB1]
MTVEEAKIDRLQLFLLILLFELGTAIVIPLGTDAGRDAWLAVLLGTLGGVVLFFVYYQLFLFYPDQVFSSYVQSIAGKLAGGIIAYVYILYFLYTTARDLRVFGEFLLSSFYPETPLFIINALMIVVIMYAAKNGIEVIARTGELNVFLLYLIAIFGIVLLFFSNAIDFHQLKPFLENGFFPVLKSAFTEILYMPFGEAVVFAFIFPYLNRRKGGRMIGICALLFSGLSIALTTAVNLCTLGMTAMKNTPFPLLATIKEIEVMEFLQRLDVIFLISLFIGAFFKIAIYFYASVIAIADFFRLDSHRRAVYPIGVVTLIVSMMIASNYPEHIRQGLKWETPYLHLPLQVVVPVLLLLFAFWKNRNNKKIRKTPSG